MTQLNLSLASQTAYAGVTPFNSAQARTLILSGQAPTEMTVSGSLNFANCKNLTELPAGLKVTSLDLSNCTGLKSLPPGLKCYQLVLKGTKITSLPEDLSVEYKLDLQDCKELETLPTNLKVGSLVLGGCTALTKLPEGLDVYFLDITGCTKLITWPEQAMVRVGSLIASGCTGLTALPKWLTNLSHLDVSGCINLSELPEGLQVSSWLDIANTKITVLPESLKEARLRWYGVLVDQRIVLHPETITVDEILEERNAELRRVLLERFGYDRFILQANAEVLDTDRDPGGERRLLCVPLEGDEDLVCVSVICPSTGNQYIIRVPPNMRTCRQAIAWIAGFDDPDQYQPLVET